MEDEGYDLDQEKLVKESNDTVVDILKCLDKRSFVIAGDAISRSIAFIISCAVRSNIINSSEQESIIESIAKTSRFYLDHAGDKSKSH